MSSNRLPVGGGSVKDMIPAPATSATNPLHHDGENHPQSGRSSSAASGKSTFEVDATASVASSYPRDSTTIPALGSIRNLSLLFFFSLFSASLVSISGFGSTSVYIMERKMSPLWGTSVNYICSIFGICSQIAIAYYGDSIMTRWGKRKPLLAAFWPIIALTAVIFLNPPESLGPQQVEGWYLICQIVLTICNTCYGSVFFAWFIEACADQDDFRRVFTYGISIGNGIGSLLGVAVYFVGVIPIAVVVAAIGSAAALVLVLWFFPSRVVAASSKQPPLLSSVRILSHDQEFRTVLMNKIIILTAFACGTEFLTYNAFMCFPGIKHFKQLFLLVVIFALLNSVAGIIMALLLNYLLHLKWEKINMYLSFTKGFVILAGLFFFMYVPGLATPLSISTSTILLYVWLGLVIFTIVIFSGAMFLEGLIVRDLIRFDTFKTGLNRENMYQTALGVPASILSQFTAAIPMCILTSTGLKGLPPNPNDDLLTSKYEWNKGSHIQVVVYSTLLMGGGMLLAYYAFCRYPLLQGISSKIEQAITKRENKRIQRASMYTDQKFGAVSGPNSKKSVRDSDASGDGDDGVGVEAAEDDMVGRMSASIDSGVGSIADSEEEMLMNHFSATELGAMVNSGVDSSDHKNVALKSIVFYSRINLFLVTPATVVASLAGLGIQVENQYQFAVLVVNIFLAAFLFGLYEALRLGPILELSRLPGLDVALKAKAACNKLNASDNTLKDLFAKNEINPDDPTGLRQSLIAPPTKAEDSPDAGTLAGVARNYFIVYAAQAVLFVVGLMFALFIKQ